MDIYELIVITQLLKSNNSSIQYPQESRKDGDNYITVEGEPPKENPLGDIASLIGGLATLGKKPPA